MTFHEATTAARTALANGDRRRFLNIRWAVAHKQILEHRHPRRVGVGPSKTVQLGSSSFTYYDEVVDLNREIRNNACRRANRIRRILGKTA